MPPPATVNLTSDCDAPGMGGVAKAFAGTSKLFKVESLNRTGSVTAAAAAAPPDLAAPGGAQFSQRLSKWNHSTSDMRSPAADVVGVAAVAGIMPGDGDGPGGTLVESRRTRSEAGCDGCCCEAPWPKLPVGTVGLAWARKKFAMGSLEELLIAPVGVFGTGVWMGTGSRSDGAPGVLDTMTWLKVVRM